MISFASKLVYLRKKKGLTQSELAKKLGIAQTNVSCYESGKTFPKHETLENIANILECNVDDLCPPPAEKNKKLKTPEDYMEFLKSPYSEDEYLLIAILKLCSKLPAKGKIKALNAVQAIFDQSN